MPIAMEFLEIVERGFASITDVIYGVIFYALPLDFLGAGELRLPLIVLWLLSAGVFFTFYLSFINLRGLPHAFRLIRGDYHDPSAPGHISHFRALATELSGTVGLGNIAGVAVAISRGGPGAVLWMIVAAFFSMATRYVECTLGVKYRYQDTTTNRFHGGPMYYLHKGLSNLGWPRFGKTLGILFAVCCVLGALGAGVTFQANQSFIQVMNVTGGESGPLADYGWLFGLVFAGLLAAVILGGIMSIANVASKIVPFMTLLYLGMGLFVVFSQAHLIWPSIVLIFEQAFSLDAGIGGILGAIVAGSTRAFFSNEAGIGSTPIAHSGVKTNYPPTEGLVSMTGPVFDTIIICTITALVIVISGAYVGTEGLGGVEMTSKAFASVVEWFPILLAVCVFLFAYSTAISWSYYGCKAINYLFKESERAEFIFKILACIFVVLGCISSLETTVKLSEAMMFSMAIPNILGLYILCREVRVDTRNYMKKVEKKR